MNSQTEPDFYSSPGAISESRSISSAHSPEEFLRLLDGSLVKGKRSLVPHSIHNIGGRIRENSFILRKMSKFKNGFARDLYGTAIASDHGSHIIYRFELHMAVRVMFTLWFILVTILLLAGLGSLFSGAPRFDIIVGPLLLLVMGIAMVGIAMNKGKTEERELEEFLLQIAGSRSFSTSGSEESFS